MYCLIYIRGFSIIYSAIQLVYEYVTTDHVEQELFTLNASLQESDAQYNWVRISNIGHILLKNQNSTFFFEEKLSTFSYF